MLLSSLLKSVASPTFRKSRRPSFRPRRRVMRRLAAERLEDRALLATIIWDGEAGDNDWNNAANWFDQTNMLNNVQPGAADDAVIGAAFSSETITHSSGTTSINSVTSAASLTVSGGAFTVVAASQVDGTLTLAGIATLTADGNLTVTDTFNWTGGTLTGAAATIVDGAAVINIETGTHTGTNHTIQGTGTVNWTSGTIVATALTIDVPAFNINGSSNKFLQGTLNNAGSAVWSGTGNVLVNFAGTFTNLSGALFDAQNDAGFLQNFGAGSKQFDNQGTFRKSAGAGTTVLGVELNNSGAVEVQSGTVALSGGGTQTATFDVDGPASLAFSGGTHELDTGVMFSGSGTVGVSGGTTNMNVPVNPPNFFVSGGTASLNVPLSLPSLSLSGLGTLNVALSLPSLSLSGLGTLHVANELTVTNTFDWTGGTLTGTAATVVDGAAVMNIETGTHTGTDHTIQGTGTVNWTSGTIVATGLTIDVSAFNINGNSRKILQGTLNNAGTALWSGTGNILMNLTSTLTNLPGALFDAQNDAGFAQNLGAGMKLLDNQGTFRKSAGTGTTTFAGIAFDNSGTVEVQSGTLALGGGGTQTATFDVDGPASLAFSGGTHELNSGTTISGTGTVGVSGGVTNVNVAVNPPNFFVSGGVANLNVTLSLSSISLGGFGTLNVANDLTVTNTFDWTGGTLTGAAATIVDGAAVMNIETGTHTGTDHTIQGTGSVNWTSGTIVATGLTIDVPAFNISSGSNKILQGTLNNAGTAIWSGTGNILMNLSSTFTNLPGALFEAQNDAGFAQNLGAGAKLFDNQGTFRKSSGTGTTTVNNPIVFDNSGTVEVQTGTITLGGPFTQFDVGTSTLTGGTYLIAGTFRFNDADIVTNQATIVLDGEGSQIIDQLSNNGLTNFATNDASAEFTITNGRALMTSGAFSNSGNLTIGPASTFTVAGGNNYVQLDGTTTLLNAAGTATLVADLVDIQGGSLNGEGDITGDLGNASIVNPGGPTGILNVSGDYTHAATGVLNVEIGGLTPGAQHDRINVEGTAALDGTLNVLLIGGFDPVVGNEFLILSYGARLGDFAINTGLLLADGRFLSKQFNESTLPFDLTLVTTTTGIQIDDVTVTEGIDASAMFTVTLDRPSPHQVTVDFATADDSATAGSDYTVGSATVTFEAGEVEKTITIPLLDDALDEFDETFEVHLSNAANGTITDSTGIATIEDDDPLPSLSIDDVTVNEGDGGTTTANFTVSLSAESAKTVTVDVQTADDTAWTADNDYQALSGLELTFAPGETFKIVDVTVNGDLNVEADETFFVTLSGQVNASIADSQGIGTIENDDTEVSVAVAPTSVEEDGTANLVYTFTRTGVTSGALTVNFYVAGTATFSSDYTQSGADAFSLSTGTVVFANGATSAVVTVDPTPDMDVEPDETVILTIVDGTGYTVGSPSEATGTIDNDETASGENRPPVLAEIDDQYVNEGSVLRIFAMAADPDGDELTFSLEAAPQRAAIDPVTGVFTWRPTDGVQPPESFTVVIRVSDNGTPSLSDTKSFEITVHNVIPTATISGPTKGKAGKLLPQVFRARDPSNADRAAGFVFTIDWGDDTAVETLHSTSAVTAQHGYDRAGVFTIVMTATDKDGGVSSEVSRGIVIGDGTNGKSRAAASSDVAAEGHTTPRIRHNLPNNGWNSPFHALNVSDDFAGDRGRRPGGRETVPMTITRPMAVPASETSEGSVGFVRPPVAKHGRPESPQDNHVRDRVLEEILNDDLITDVLAGWRTAHDSLSQAKDDL